MRMAYTDSRAKLLTSSLSWSEETVIRRLSGRGVPLMMLPSAMSKCLATERAVDLVAVAVSPRIQWTPNLSRRA